MTRNFITSLSNSFDLPGCSLESKKRYTLKLLLMCLKALGGGFSDFLEIQWEWVCRKLLPLVKPCQRFWIWNIKHGFTNCGCLHSAILEVWHVCEEKRAPNARDMEFFLQHVKNEIFKILKCLKTKWNSPEQPAELTQK